MKKKFGIPIALKFVLFYSSILHIVGGVMFIYDNNLARLYGEIVFGMNINITSQIGYIIKMLGIYSLLIGVIIIMIAKNPYKYSMFIWVLILLYLSRFIYSVTSFNFMYETFDVSKNDMYLSSSILFISLILLIVGKFQLNKNLFNLDE